MSKKHLLYLIFITIFTLGLFWIWFYYKKQSYQPKEKLSQNLKTPFPIEKLLDLLGNNNVSKAEATHTKIKIWITNSQLVQVDEIKKLKSVSGSFLTSQNLTLIVGNSAKTIADIINAKIFKEK